MASTPPLAFTRAGEDVVFVAVACGWLRPHEALPAASTCRALAVRIDAYLRHDARELRVSDSAVGEEALAGLLRRCRGLQTVELRRCGPDVSDLALFALHGLRLREFRLEACPSTSPAGVREALLAQPGFADAIRVLDVDLAPLYVADEPEFPNLVEFGARSLGSGEEAAAVAAKVLRAAAKSLRVLRLRGFTLQQVPTLLAEGLDFGPRRLDALHVIGEPEYTLEDPLADIGPVNVCLGAFVCQGRFCTHEVLAQVARGSKTVLRSLDLSGKSSWTSLEPVGRHCHELRELCIRDRALLGDTVLSPVLANCHALQRLCVLGARGVTSISVRSAAATCPNLRCLELAGCDLVDDGSLHALAVYARNLEELNLTGCKLITNAGVKALAKSPVGSRVRRLEVANCSKLADEAMLAVARWMRAMQRLDCSWCTLVTFFSLEEVIMECPVLVSLRVHGNPMPSTDAIVLAKRSQGPFCLDLGPGAIYRSGGRPRAQAATAPASDPALVRAQRQAAARARRKKRAKRDLRKLEQVLLENNI